MDSRYTSPNIDSKKLMKKELEEIEEVKIGYFVNEKVSGRKLDQIDHLIMENNIAITSVLEKFKNTPSHKERQEVNIKIPIFIFFNSLILKISYFWKIY